MFNTSLHCVSENKRLPFYFGNTFVRCHLILLILGRNIPRGVAGSGSSELNIRLALRWHHAYGRKYYAVENQF